MQRKHISWVKTVMITLALSEAAVIFIGIQFIPYGPGSNNPPVIAEPQWDSLTTRKLFFRACGDCHSNETSWPWYGVVAPISWFIQRDVDRGRTAFNVSEWRRGESEGSGVAETIRSGSMPPLGYTFLRPSARLSASEKQAFSQGLAATFGSRHGSAQRGRQEGE